MLSDSYIKRKSIDTKDNDKSFNDLYNNLNEDFEINKTLDFLKIHDFSYFDIFEKYKEDINFKNKDFNFVEELKKIIIFIYMNRWIIKDLKALENLFNRHNLRDFLMTLKEMNGDKIFEYMAIAKFFVENRSSYSLPMNKQNLEKDWNDSLYPYKEKLFRFFFSENNISENKYELFCKDFFCNYIIFNDEEKIGEELLNQIKLNESRGDKKNIFIFCSKNYLKFFSKKNTLEMKKNQITDEELSRCYEFCCIFGISFEIFLQKIKSLMNDDYKNFFNDVTVVATIKTLFSNIIIDKVHKAFEKSQKNGLLASQSIFVFDGLEHVMKNLGSHEDNQIKVMQIFESIRQMSGKKYKMNSDNEAYYLDYFKSIFFLQNVMFILVGDLDYLGNYSSTHYDRVSKFVNNRIDKQDRTIDDYKKYFVKSEKLKAYLRQLKNKTGIEFEIYDGAIDWICKIAFNNRKTLDTIMMDKFIVQLGEKLLEDYINYNPEKDQKNLFIDENYLKNMNNLNNFFNLVPYNYHL